MAHADANDVHVNRLLTMVSVGYDPGGFIADQIFPQVMVNKQSDIVPFYDQSPWFRDEGQGAIRAPGTEANKTGLTVDNTNNYFCINNALGADVPYEIRDNQDAPYDMERDVSQLIQGLLMLRRDRKFAADHMVADAFMAQTVSAKWSDYANSNPIQDMRAAQRGIRRSIAARGNTWVLGDLVWQRLQDHPDLLNRLPDNTLRRTTKGALAALLDLPGEGSILCGESMYTTSAEGTAEGSVTYADVWDDAALCLYRPSVAGLMKPTAGYTFFWRNSVAPNAPQFVRRWDDTHKKKTVVEVHTYFAQKKLLTKAGRLILDVTD